MKMRSGTPSNGLRLQVLPSLQMANTAPDGFKIPFSAGHTRRMLRLTRGPFRYKRYADRYLEIAMRYAHVPVKQAVISASALSLMYPPQEIENYSREQFIDDLLNEARAHNAWRFRGNGQRIA